MQEPELSTTIETAQDIAVKMQRVVKAARFIYGEQWKDIKERTQLILQRHIGLQKFSMLEMAIQLAGSTSDPRQVLILLAAAVDDETEPF